MEFIKSNYTTSLFFLMENFSLTVTTEFDDSRSAADVTFTSRQSSTLVTELDISTIAKRDDISTSDTTTVSAVDLDNTPESTIQSLILVLDLYAPPVLILIGSVCNFLVIMVMRAKYFRHVSTSFYILINALIDNLSLLLCFPPHWLYVNYSEIVQQSGEAGDYLCKIVHFLGAFTSNFGIALTSAMSIERAVAINLPLRALSLCTVKRAKYVSLILAGALALKEIHFMIMSSLVPPNITAYGCEIKLELEWFQVYVQTVYPVIHNVFLGLAYSLLIGSNIIIIHSVHSSLPMLQSLPKDSTTSTDVQQRRAVRTRQLTIMLLLDSISVIVLTLPLTLYNFIQSKFQDPSVGHLVYSIAFYMVYLNRCANFFLYCISGQRFRQQLASVFKSFTRTYVDRYALPTASGSSSRNTSEDITISSGVVSVISVDTLIDRNKLSCE